MERISVCGLAMPKFFKGQTVKIKKLVDIKNTEAFPTLVDEMEKFCGKKGEITYSIKNTYGNGVFAYHIFGWAWREDWIEVEDFLTEKDFEI